MCGIAGIIDLKHAPGREPDRGFLKSMTDAISHRGPDAGNFHFEPGIALGHRRLSIIDIASGHQPMCNEDDSVWVVFNGEIYNFESVRTELELLGHRFKTNSDTEIIVHGWEAWGTECLAKFRGMFAFVLWDRNKRKVFMARDRLGVKPMYYSVLDSGLLLFGSELKALTAHPQCPKQINDAAIEDYLALGYIPDPKSIYQSIHKLPPAHFILWSVAEQSRPAEMQPQRYWSVPFGQEQKISEVEAVEQLEQLLAESIRLRMISEVPLGAFLSGGVDSSVVVAAMSAVSDQPVKTCSIGFDAAGFDETEYAQAVAKQYKTDHSEFRVSGDDSVLFNQLTDIYDEPYADASAIPTFRVCQLARQRVTVALSGDGGDETFGGYRRYRLHMGEEKVRSAIPIALRKMLFKPLGVMYPKLGFAPQWMRAKSTFQGLARDSVEAYFHSVSITPLALRQQLKTSQFNDKLQGYEAYEVFRKAAAYGPANPMSMIQHIDYETYLPGDINVKVDRASMAHSLEVREPLMDHKLVEWAAKLDRNVHIDPMQGKKVLKSLARRSIPSDIIDRPKQGFIVPINHWLKGSLGDQIGNISGDGRLYNYVDRAKTNQLLDQHREGKADHSRCLWSLALLDAFLARQ
jgi:asparagine synthase (glutamine-hydrolysing)